MRLLIWTIAFFLIAAVIKIDLQEGTLPMASFYSETCEKKTTYKTVRVKIAQGDTIYSLFAATPMAAPIPFSERLTLFFQYNPHLQKQPFVAGEEVIVPIEQINQCENM